MFKKIILFIVNIITMFLLAIFIIALIFLVKSKTTPNHIPSVMGYRLMTVLSGSMKPLLEPGDIILIRTVNHRNIRVGDVVTYKIKQSLLVTHRITHINKKSNELMFKTKGDANNVEDENVVSQSQLIGLMIFCIPYGGYIAQFIRTPFGITMLAFLSIVIIIVSEIKKEILRRRTN